MPSAWLRRRPISSRRLAGAAAAILLLLFEVSAAPSSPAALFTASTVNPAVGSLVLFSDASAGNPTSWSWDFGDGASSTDRSPGHTFRAAGTFAVRLTVSAHGGSAATTIDVTVTPAELLRLNAAHRFDVTLSARDPRTGATGTGVVLGQNDVYGYFSLPAISGNAGNPELLVKIVDASAIGQNYWVFYGSMTDFDFTLSVKETETGIVKSYSSDPAKASGQFDTSGFSGTPPPPDVQIVTVETRAWEFHPGTTAPIVLQVGIPYRLRFHDVDPPGTTDPHHGFTGVSDLGISGTSDTLIGPGQDFVTEVFTPQPFQRGAYPFACTNTDCGGDPQQHASMLGTILIQ